MPTPSNDTSESPTPHPSSSQGKAGVSLRTVVLPPGYDAKAARSTLRRYPKQVVAAMRSIAGSPAGGHASPRPTDPHAQSDLWHPDRMRDALSRMQQAPLASMWLGHATVLLRLDGRWILTDPVLSDQIGVRVGLRTAGLTIGPRRLLPAPPPELLPPLDLIVLSHAHFDHLDRPTLAKLASKRTRVLTASGTAKLVPRGFASVHEILWDTQAEHDGLRVQSIKPAHWGARTMWDRHRGFASYVLRSPHLGVLYAGDTARTDAYANLSPLRTGQPALQLSIFGIGAYDPWIAAHANPEEVWQMHQQSGARCLMPMHHSTFVLSDEPLQEPLQRLMSVAGPQSDRVVGTTLGQPWLLD